MLRISVWLGARESQPTSPVGSVTGTLTAIAKQLTTGGVPITLKHSGNLGGFVLGFQEAANLIYPVRLSYL